MRSTAIPSTVSEAFVIASLWKRKRLAGLNLALSVTLLVQIGALLKSNPFFNPLSACLIYFKYFESRESDMSEDTGKTWAL
jgi:hypothetical protein